MSTTSAVITTTLSNYRTEVVSRSNTRSSSKTLPTLNHSIHRPNSITFPNLGKAPRRSRCRQRLLTVSLLYPRQHWWKIREEQVDERRDLVPLVKAILQRIILPASYLVPVDPSTRRLHSMRLRFVVVPMLQLQAAHPPCRVSLTTSSCM